MKNNLKIVNMVLTTRLPFSRKLNIKDIKKLINKFGYMGVNEECSPIYCKRVKIREKIELSIHKKEKQPYVSLWCSGALIIVGVRSKKEASQVYDIVINELKTFRGLLK